MISVSFRFDDPSPGSDQALERNIITILTRHQVPACFAVVPVYSPHVGESKTWTPQGARHLIEAQQAGIVEIAQHGDTHLDRGKAVGGGLSEFSGITLSQQLAAIKHGCTQLNAIFGLVPRGFVPPWNSYDKNTSKAVREAGLCWLSASWAIHPAAGLPIIPRTCTLRNAADTINAAARFSHLDPLIVVVFHPDDFEEFWYPPADDEPPPFINLQQFEALVAQVSDDPDIQIETLGQIAGRQRSGQALWSLENQRWYEHLPHRLRNRLPKNVLMSGSRWSALPTLLRGPQ